MPSSRRQCHWRRNRGNFGAPFTWMAASTGPKLCPHPLGRVPRRSEKGASAPQGRTFGKSPRRRSLAYRSTSRSHALTRTTLRASRSRSALATMAKPRPSASSRKRKLPPRRRCWRNFNEPLRSRRCAGRAKRGQVDTGGCTGWAESGDRGPQGPNDPRALDGQCA